MVVETRSKKRKRVKRQNDAFVERVDYGITAPLGYAQMSADNVIRDATRFAVDQDQLLQSLERFSARPGGGLYVQQLAAYRPEVEAELQQVRSVVTPSLLHKRQLGNQKKTVRRPAKQKRSKAVR